MKTYCTICGVRVVASGRLHLAGGTFRYSTTPVSHEATADPRYLLVWLRMAGAWVPAEVAADAG